MPAPHVMPVDANDNVVGSAASPTTVTVTGTTRQYRDSTVTVQASGSPTAPTAGAAIATVTVPAAGLWEIATTFFLSGTVAATDANNLQIRQNTTPRLSPLVLPAVANAFPAPTVVVLNCAANDTVTINAIAAGSASAIYSAAVVARQVG